MTMTTGGASAPARTTFDRIPSLDGLRAISIGLVLVSHMAGTRGFPISEAVTNPWALGIFGVTVFFVISGFLITGLLLDELRRTGTIALGRFYFRRTLRIFPPYFTLLLAMAAASAAGWVVLNPRDLLHAATYTSNYHDGRSWYVAHSWSLSVEEQFYLLWPAVLLFARTRRALLIAAATILLVPVIRVAEWELIPSAQLGIGFRFETIADALAAGCVLACARHRLHASRLYMRVLSSPAFVVVPAAAVAANLTHDHPLVAFGAASTVINVCVALCIDWAVTFHDGRIGRVLNAAPLVFVGWISYSLYLWQQPFLNRDSTAWPAAFPANIILTFVAAVASYYLVERTSLQLRKRLEWRRKRRPRESGTLPAAAPTPSAAAALD